MYYKRFLQSPEGAVCGRVASWLWAAGKTAHHGENTQYSQTSYFTDGKQKQKGGAPSKPLQVCTPKPKSLQGSTSLKFPQVLAGGEAHSARTSKGDLKCQNV